MKEVKCECGHVNPHGTVLCEACGKILKETETNKTLVEICGMRGVLAALKLIIKQL